MRLPSLPICDFLAAEYGANHFKKQGRLAFRRMPKHSRRGVPDIIVIKDGQFIGLEVKRPGTYQSPEQKAFKHDVATAGGRYHVVRSIEDVTTCNLPRRPYPDVRNRNRNSQINSWWAVAPVLPRVWRVAPRALTLRFDALFATDVARTHFFAHSLLGIRRTTGNHRRDGHDRCGRNSIYDPHLRSFLLNDRCLNSATFSFVPEAS